MFFWNSLAFSMIQRMLAIWSLVPLPFLKPAWTSGSSQFSIAKALENFEHYFASMWDECQLCGSLIILWHCLSLGLKWKLTFSSPVATAEFSKFVGILSAALSQHHLSGFEYIYVCVCVCVCICVCVYSFLWLNNIPYKEWEMMPFAAIWMDLEIIILNELSQR